MTKPWLSTSRKLAACLLACLLLSCAGLAEREQPGSPLPEDCWLQQKVVYRLRHSAKLEYQGKQEMLEGFMELDLKKERAHLIIFNRLGLTLLNLEIEPSGYKFAQSNPDSNREMPANRREQQFAKTVATAVQHIFFSLTKKKKEAQANKPKRLIEFSEVAPELITISEYQQKPAWVATYNNYREFMAGRLPERITLENYKPRFTITLWLHKAELLTETSR